MTKGSIWIWLFFSIVVGVLFIMFLKDFFVKISYHRMYEMSMKDFDNLFSELNSACHSEIGYAKRFEYQIYPCVNFLSTDKSDGEVGKWITGNTICLNTTKDIICRKLDCNLNMTIMGYVSPENDPFSKNKEYTCYDLLIKKINATTIILCSCRCEAKYCQCDNI